jgi:hypothetical protein
MQRNENLTWSMLEHLLLNRFAVGIFSTLEPLCYQKKIAHFCSLEKTKETFEYTKTEEAFQKAMTASHASEKMIMPPPGWMIYYRELYQQMGTMIHSLVFYALPVLEVQRREYQTAFAAKSPAHTVMLGPASPTFMKTMLHHNYWFDGVHPTAAGALFFTDWLAGELFSHWSEVITTRWKLSDEN